MTGFPGREEFLERMKSEKRKFPIFIVLALLSLFISSSESTALFSSQPYIPDSIVTLSSGYAIVVDKQAQKLYVFQKDGFIKKVFEAPCSTGKKPGAKQEPGDSRTPNGIFFVYRYYSNAELTSIYGPMAFHLDFPNLFDRRAGRNGTNIWIHGTNKPLQPFQSNGCVAMRNRDIEQLAGYIFLNKTPVIIEESIKWVSQEKAHPGKDELERIMYAWDRAVNEGDSRALDMLYMSDSRDRSEHKLLLQKAQHLKSLVNHLPMYPRDVSILREENVAVILFDKITSVKTDTSFQGSYVKLFLERSSDRWMIVEETSQPVQTALATRAARAAAREREAQAAAAASQQQAPQAQPPQQAQPAQPQKAAAPPVQAQAQTGSQDNSAITQLVEKWASSWQSGDMREYRSCFAPDFKSKGMNLSKYIEYKTDLARKYKHITVRVSNLKISHSGGQTASVTFVQKYSAAGGPKTSGMKKLELKKVKDSWKISRETMSR